MKILGKTERSSDKSIYFVYLSAEPLKMKIHNVKHLILYEKKKTLIINIQPKLTLQPQSKCTVYIKL